MIRRLKRLIGKMIGNVRPATSTCSGCPSSDSCGGCSLSQSQSIPPSPTRPLAHSPAPSIAPTHGGDCFDRSLTRRDLLKAMGNGAALTAASAHGLNPLGVLGSSQQREIAKIDWKEFFKSNYRVMTDRERADTVERLERRYKLAHGNDIHIGTGGAQEDVLYGYAFNVSKCKGYRECIRACVEENNQDRAGNMQYIRVFEKKEGAMDVGEGTAEYFHEVPADGHFYIATQCFQCDNPPCVDVCPTGATWKEKDGIVVIDYDWCIGCRYCEAGCPYWARRFNWKEPQVPENQVNPEQHYLGNRMRKKGVMEKCTYCIQRTRKGRLPACAEACPTGARTFGNLLDPNSELRYILDHKKVFRLKEDLNTEPKFWYYMD